MMQTRLESMLESSVNTFIGFFTAFLTWQLIANPLFHYHVTFGQNFEITSIFTAVSVVRGYLCRRFFNSGLHKAVKAFVQRIYRRES